MCSQQRAGPREDAFTLRRKPFKALPAHDQHQPQLLFQAADAHGEGRLGDVALRGRFTKVAGLVECD